MARLVAVNVAQLGGNAQAAPRLPHRSLDHGFHAEAIGEFEGHRLRSAAKGDLDLEPSEEAAPEGEEGVEADEFAEVLTTDELLGRLELVDPRLKLC